MIASDRFNIQEMREKQAPLTHAGVQLIFAACDTFT